MCWLQTTAGQCARKSTTRNQKLCAGTISNQVMVPSWRSRGRRRAAGHPRHSAALDGEITAFLLQRARRDRTRGHLDHSLTSKAASGSPRICWKPRLIQELTRTSNPAFFIALRLLSFQGGEKANSTVRAPPLPNKVPLEAGVLLT